MLKNNEQLNCFATEELDAINEFRNKMYHAMHAVCIYLCVTVTNWDLHKASEQ